MKSLLRPYLNSIETFDDLIEFEKTNLFLLAVGYFSLAILMVLVVLHLFQGKFDTFANSILGMVYFTNVAGMLAGAAFAKICSLKTKKIKSYADLEKLKKKFYLFFYLMTGVPFMGFIAWAIVYADLRFAFEMILAFVATAGALYFGDWKSFKGHEIRIRLP